MEVSFRSLEKCCSLRRYWTPENSPTSMDEVVIRRELTKSIRLGNEPDVLPGCVLKIFEFDSTKPKYLKEIHFSNYYAGRVSAKVCLQEAGSFMPIWADLFRIQLMPYYHYCPGSCANVKVKLPANFKTVEAPQRIQRAVFMLQQPSPTWRDYSINAVKFYSDYVSSHEQSGVPAGCEVDEAKTDPKCSTDELGEILKRIHELLQFQRENKIGDSTVRYDMNQLSGAKFDIK
ncbi:hypothetical protein FGIG_10012 [Fasciola gigantica]|uniref:Uncharacterized protein n=1 Tax=Fasciola gigantica TaxID=46835 RepID=A0A504Y8R1_FASGI|nr:hypothetical protein FGIG_10012 [Fasciola gigantica]